MKFIDQAMNEDRVHLTVVCAMSGTRNKGPELNLDSGEPNKLGGERAECFGHATKKELKVPATQQRIWTCGKVDVWL